MKKIFIITFIFSAINFFAVDLPHPKNDQLFTEYESYRYAKYLKKPITGSGYIAMDTKEKFVFIQTSPVYVAIKKNGNRVSYKKGNSMPVDISNMSMDMFFLFEESDKINANYNITKSSQDDKDLFEIIPKQGQNLKLIKVTGREDVFEKAELFFNDGSRILYVFKNTMTGKRPDEKYF